MTDDGADKRSDLRRRTRPSTSGHSTYPPYPAYPAYSPYPPYPPHPPYPPYPNPCPGDAAQPRAPCPEVCEPCGEGGGGGEPSGGPPGWGEPDSNGWQCWNAPFTLPLTRANWPARYLGAPDPSAADVVQFDVTEAGRRLGALALAAGLTPEQQQEQLSMLRSELDRLVENFPATLLSDVPLNAPSSANAPTLGLSLIQQLLLLAADPYFARGLGVYFVDTDIEDGVAYDYCLAGDWGATQPAVDRKYAGLAPAAALSGGALSKGAATIDGLTLQPSADATLWRWTRDDANGQHRPLVDPAAPLAAGAALTAAVAAISPSSQPEAVLAVLATSSVAAVLAPSLTLSLPQGWPQVDVQVGGAGMITGFSAGAPILPQPFSSAALTTVTLAASGSGQGLLDRIQIAAAPQFSTASVFCVGEVSLHRLPPAPIGLRYALLHAPQPLTPPPAPDPPLATYRRRDADVDPTTLTVTPRSLVEVEWPAPDPVGAAGDPVSDPANLPPPWGAIAFVAERQDSGAPGSATRLPRRVIAASSPKPQYSKLTSAREFRFTDPAAPDPQGGWSYRVAGFDVFGALGSFGPWTAPLGVERIAAAPIQVKIRGFDNSPGQGGVETASPPAWSGGTLTVLVSWSGGARLMYPDILTARVTAEAVDVQTGAVGPTLATQDVIVPPPTVSALSVVSVSASPAGSATWQVDVATTPPLPLLQDDEPSLALILTANDGGRERYVVRPTAPSPGAAPIARFTVGGAARLAAAPNDFVGQQAYLVQGFATTVAFPVPVTIPLGQTTASAQASVTGSTQNPFAADEQIVDPNGVNPPRPQPQSTIVRFTAPQRLVPPTPDTPIQTHGVHHLTYDPADFNGRAGVTLPFNTAAAPGVDGFVLQRCPVQSLFLADMKRRLALANAADPQPDVSDSGVSRADLKAWIDALPAWLAAYNAGGGGRSSSAWTMANVLTDSAARQAFVNHFYGGLLDDELRALADLPDNATGFARVNSSRLPTGAQIKDAVDGTGFGRTLYALAAINNAGTASAATGSIGPYYTRIVAPPQAPVLFRVQPTTSSITVEWTLDDNPDVAAYLVYRGKQVGDLADLRWFGDDPAFPATSGLASVVVDPKSAAPVSFGGGKIDPRIIALAPDPRMCALDYDGSDMGEVPLPSGPPPDQMNAVFRATDYDPSRAPLDQPQAFNYWTPPAVGGIAQVVSDSPTQSRLTGLRIGLGRRTPVVVVATFAGSPKVMGALPARRASFLDGLSAAGEPLDPNTLPGYAAPAAIGNAYAIVALDVFGNRSPSSKVFAAKLLG